MRFFSGNSLLPKGPQQDPQPSVKEPDKTGITLIIDDGGSIATYSGIQADNAFAALTEAGKTGNILIRSKQYDFGVFVESVAGKENSKDYAWIYFVNGTSGDVAADRMKINAGDMVEWKYTKPIY
jgi:hypothetical protein